MMNCQSDDWASNISRAAWASTGRAAGRSIATGTASQKVSSSAQTRSQVQTVVSPEPHAEVAVGAPGAGGHRDRLACGVLGEVARGGDGPHPALLARERAVDPAEAFGAFEPPVTEELGIERRDDDAPATLALAGRDAGEQSGEVFRMLLRARAGLVGVVGLLVAEIHAAAGHRQSLSPPGQRILWNSR